MTLTFMTEMSVNEIIFSTFAAHCGKVTHRRYFEMNNCAKNTIKMKFKVHCAKLMVDCSEDH